MLKLTYTRYLISETKKLIISGDFLLLIKKIFRQILNTNKINLDKLVIKGNLSLDDLLNKFGSENGTLDTKKTYSNLRHSKKFREKFSNYEKWILRSVDDENLFEHQSGIKNAPIFEKYLNPYKDKQANFIKIGSRGGHTIASLFYYLKKMNFYTISFKSKNKFLFTSKRIFFKKINVRNTNQVKKFLKKNSIFEIIYDDEFHYHDDIILNFKNFINHCSHLYIMAGFKYDDALYNKLKKYNYNNSTKMYYPSNLFDTKEIFNLIKKKEFFDHKVLDRIFLENLYKLDYEINTYNSDHPAGELIIFKKNI